MEISLPGAENFVGLLINFGMMQFNKNEFMKTPQMVMYIRIASVISFFIQLIACLYIKRKIASSKNEKKFKYKPSPSILNVSDNADREVEITFAEYDNNEATSMLRSLIFQSFLYCFISWKFNSNQTLIVAALGLFKNLFFSPLYRAYIFNLHIERPYDRNLLFGNKPADEVTPVEKKKKKEE